MKLRTMLLAGLIAVAGTTSIAVIAQNDVRIPPAVAAKLDKLSPAQREFMLSDKVERFVNDHGELFRRFENKSPDEIAAYVQAMMDVVEASKFQPGKDLAELPVDTTQPDFNRWRTLRPRELDPKREPGPISLSRYMANRDRNGIPTFFGLPMALTPEDLTAGAVDVAIVGAPLSLGNGTRGMYLGPNAVRTTRGVLGPDIYTAIDIGQAVNVVDYGDIAVDNMSTERSMEHVRQMVADMARAGTVPIIIGGDHSLLYPNGAAMADVYGKGQVGVVHFDSHWDFTSTGIHAMSHGQPIYRLIKENHVAAKNFIQVGQRTLNIDKIPWMRQEGLRYHTMAEVLRSGWKEVMERALREARDGPDKLYISFDVDVLDPAYMVGTGTPVSNGLTMREAIHIIRRLCAEKNVVGFELVELDPTTDPTYVSAWNSAQIVRACISGISLRKKGLTAPDYLAPTMIDNGIRTRRN